MCRSSLDLNLPFSRVQSNHPLVTAVGSVYDVAVIDWQIIAEHLPDTLRVTPSMAVPQRVV